MYYHRFTLPLRYQLQALEQANIKHSQGNRKVQTHFAFDQSSEWCGGESTPLIGIHLS